MNVLNGVRVDTDGTRTAVAVPTGDGRHNFLRAALGGWPEYAHYGTVNSAVCAIVHETGRLDGLPTNETATQFVGLLRGGLPDYWLYGPVILLGYEPSADTLLSLSEGQQALLDGLEEAVAEEAAWRGYMAGLTPRPSEAGERDDD